MSNEKIFFFNVLSYSCNIWCYYEAFPKNKGSKIVLQRILFLWRTVFLVLFFLQLNIWFFKSSQTSLKLQTGVWVLLKGVTLTTRPSLLCLTRAVRNCILHLFLTDIKQILQLRQKGRLFLRVFLRGINTFLH